MYFALKQNSLPHDKRAQTTHVVEQVKDFLAVELKENIYG